MSGAGGAGEGFESSPSTGFCSIIDTSLKFWYVYVCMNGVRLKSISIGILKGLRGVTLNFNEGLTAIMGVNGAGKTTVLHALACAYKPRVGSKCLPYRFQDFFIPNTDSLWQGSSFEIVYETTDNRNGKQEHNKQYRKDTDRWKPRFKNRPTRNVYYIGIDSCLPDIESIKTKSRINYSKHLKIDEASQKIINLASAILGKDYATLLENETNKRVFPGVELSCGLTYSSLSMGTGEQRILKILETVVHAENNSLILIDEIDLLLHVSAFNNLLNVLKSIARDNHLQIIFTTHSLEIKKHSEDIGIQYISPVSGSENTDGVPISVVFDSINSEIIHDLTNERICPTTIYVEDVFSRTVVRNILAELDMRKKTDVNMFGAASNAFTLAASLILENKDIANTLILIDGDVYRTEEEKIKQLNRAISGKTSDDMIKRKKALSLISQFNLPEGKNPEKFLYDLLLMYGDKNSDVFSEARKIKDVDNNHDWITKISSALGEDASKIEGEIISMIKETNEWLSYIDPIKKWISSRRTL